MGSTPNEDLDRPRSRPNVLAGLRLAVLAVGSGLELDATL